MTPASESQRMRATNFDAERIGKTASIFLNGKIEDIFPLFGPIREKEWAHGWNPQIIYPHNVLVEEHMIFKTKAHDVDEGEYHWCITQYKPQEFLIEYTVYTIERIWFIRVKCRADKDITQADISYTYTGFTQKGNKLNQHALERMYALDLKDWEEAINYYLKTGEMLIH